MPSIAEQHQWMGFFTAPVTVVRLLTHLGMFYEAAKKRAAPYTKIVEELSEMWGETVDLVKKSDCRESPLLSPGEQSVRRQCVHDGKSPGGSAARAIISRSRHPRWPSLAAHYPAATKIATPKSNGGEDLQCCLRSHSVDACSNRRSRSFNSVGGVSWT